MTNANPLELDLPDSFHRIKRTLMVICGSLVLLGSSDSVLALQSQLVGDASPSTSVLRLALLIAATYYYWGFYFEFQAAKRANSGLIDPDVLPQYELQAKAFTERLGTHVGEAQKLTLGTKPTLDSALASLNAATVSFGRDIDGYLESGLERVLARQATHPPETAIRRQQLNRREQEVSVPHSLEHIVREANQNVSKAAANLDRFATAIANLSTDTRQLTELTRKAADRIRLNRAIYRDRRLSFFGWEGGGALAVYVVAVICTLTPLGFMAGDFVETAARAAYW